MSSKMVNWEGDLVTTGKKDFMRYGLGAKDSQSVQGPEGKDEVWGQRGKQSLFSESQESLSRDLG